VVEYSIEGRRFDVRGRDGDTVRLTGAIPRIVVEKAIYGVPGDAVRTRDVKARVQAIVDAGEDSFAVARMAQGDDPAFLVVKTLDLGYVIDGRHVALKATDPETVNLALDEPSERVVQARRVGGGGADGGIELTAWLPGRYEVRTASGRSRTFEVPAIPPPLPIAGPWELRFPADAGAPERVALEALASWSEHADPGVRYFSGTATYVATLTVPADLLAVPAGGVAVPAGPPAKGRRLVLDLGKVQVMARVTLNGKDLGLLWRPPYRVDVTDVVKAGENLLEVRVTNLWPNRLIGDEELPEDSERNPDGTLKAWPKWLQEGKPSPTGRRTFTSWRLWRKGAALLESGLIGPVALEVAETIRVPRAE
jgi:hypothetical protein